MIDNFPGNSSSFKFKQKTTGQTENDEIKMSKKGTSKTSKQVLENH